MDVHNQTAEPWKITLINTGDETNTGGRLKQVHNYIKDEKSFCFTYGDGLSNINISNLIKFHEKHGKLATVTAVQPPGRYGALEILDGKVTNFLEKPRGDGAFINGGFFVLSPKCMDFISDDQCSWENESIAKIIKQNEMMAFEHKDFWHPMDTLRDKNFLEDLWVSGKSPWKVWK
jgi:glucose-1-phosphate cytidylyltransferase